MLVAVFMAVSVGAVTSLESNSEEFLENSSESIGEPRQGRDQTNATVLDLPANWERPTAPTVAPPTPPPTSAPPTTPAPTPAPTPGPTPGPTPAPTPAPTPSPTPPPTESPDVFNGDKAIDNQQVATVADLCLTMSGGVLIQQDCASAPLLTAQENASGTSEIRIGNQCLGAQNGATANLTRLVTTTCGSATTEWVVQGSGPFQFVNTAASAAQGRPMCADVEAGSLASGTAIILWPCHGGANQDFGIG